MSYINKINEIADKYKDRFEGTLESVPDWFISDKLNEQSSYIVKKYIPITCKDIKGLLIIWGKYSIIKDFSMTGENPVKALCVNVLEAINGFDTLDMNNPDYLTAYIGIINNLEQVGIISVNNKEILLSFIIQTDVTMYEQSWAQINKTVVDARSVGIERGAIA